MKHNDPVKAGNIVYWEDGEKYPEVVLYVKTADWQFDNEARGKRFARLSDAPGNAFWMEVSKLKVARDTRSSNRTKQYEFLNEFNREKQEALDALLKAKYG